MRAPYRFVRIWLLSIAMATLPSAHLWAVVAQEEVSVCARDEEGRDRAMAVDSAQGRALLVQGLAYEGPCAVPGPPALLGGVPVRTCVQLTDDGRPLSLGVRFLDSLFLHLPQEPADGYRCLDVNRDDWIDIWKECVGGLEYLQRVREGVEPSACHPIPRPQEVENPGFYPRRYCVRYLKGRGEMTVSLEDFDYRSNW
ncbi:MAG: hypothetical protein ACE5GJ_07550 [Gemmatimonadota bacterium]